MPNKSLDMVLSFLADPYNDEDLWAEIDRVLREKGHWVVTVPSHKWSKKFRIGNSLKKSRFLTRDGQEVDLPSITYPISKIISGVESRGLQLRNFISYTTEHLTGSVSRKLHTQGSGSSVLDCFLFEKDNR